MTKDNQDVIINKEMNKIYNIEIYEDNLGRSEVKEYIKNLKNKCDIKDNGIKYRKIIAYTRLLSEKGLAIGEPYIKKIDNNLWELRPLRDRIIFAVAEENKIVLLSVFMKQTKKTPKKEIHKAEKLLKDYKKRS